MNGIDTGVVVSSRVRLARNLDGFNFPTVLKNFSAQENVLRRVISPFIARGDFDIIRVDQLGDLEKQALIEQYVISKNLANKQCSAVCVKKEKRAVDVILSAMINEEDHIREQCIATGNNLSSAYGAISELDNFLQRQLRFARSEEGYLTACPSNLGSGMRASVMMFLPALSYTDKLGSVIENANRCQITFRGAFGEGSVAEGYWYQISNSVTRCRTNEILQKVEDFVNRVCEAENIERFNLYEIHKDEFMDKCLRAYGILKNCYLITYEECLDLVAKVKLANAIGFLPLKNPQMLDDLIVAVRPATLKSQYSDDDRDECLLRADSVKKAFEII